MTMFPLNWTEGIIISFGPAPQAHLILKVYHLQSKVSRIPDFNLQLPTLVVQILNFIQNIQ